MWVGRVTVNILPDEVLLQIFHFNRVWHYRRRRTWRWDQLVHVCRRWRFVVFASPNFLQLRLICGPKTRAELTGVWPPMPIIIQDDLDWSMPEDYDFDTAIAHPNRVCEINLYNLKCSQLERLASVMQQQFPALTHLKLRVPGNNRHPSPTLPSGLLGGSAPSLQLLRLHSIAFPALPNLLLSTTDLVHLTLWDIPHSGYISPTAMVTALAALAKLKVLAVGFQSPLSRPDHRSRRPPPQARTVFPALTRFEYNGVSEYLEDVVAQIDAPMLGSIKTTFYHQLTFDIPQLAQFMRRTTRIGALDGAHVNLYHNCIQVESLPPEQTVDEKSRLTITCRKLDWQLSSISSLAGILTSFFPFIYMVEHLYIRFNGPRYIPTQRQEDIENRRWMEIFQLFTAVKTLFVCKEFAECNAFTCALQELVGERVMNMLPALESLSLEEIGTLEPTIGQFVVARQFLDRPVTISQWNMT